MLTPTPYQHEIANAVAGDVIGRCGTVFTVEMPLGAGVRELVSQLELLVLTVNVNAREALLRVDSADGPRAELRTVSLLREKIPQALWSVVGEAEIRLGRSRVCYATPDQLMTLEGSFALIQIVDAQTLDEADLEKVRLLARASGATAVFYGRPSHEETPFERLKATNRSLQGVDGRRRHFRVPLERALAELPKLSRRVSAARQAMGETHPDYRAHYELLSANDTGVAA